MADIVKAESCGNAFLFGEYAALVGGPSIIAGLSGPLTVLARKAEKNRITSEEFKEPTMVGEVVSFFKEKYNIQENICLKIVSSVPAKKGFGSSDACIVSTYGALLKLFNEKTSKKKILSELYSFKSKKKTCSIGALAATVYGGLVKVQSNKVVAKKQFQNSKKFLFVYSGLHGHGVIKEFLQMYERETKCKQLISSMNTITSTAWSTLRSEHIGELMNEYQELFEFIKASNHKMNSLIDSSKKAGACGAKISGGGAGDCIVAYAPKNLDSFEKKNECYRFGHTAGFSVTKI